MRPLFPISCLFLFSFSTLATVPAQGQTFSQSHPLTQDELLHLEEAYPFPGPEFKDAHQQLRALPFVQKHPDLHNPEDPLHFHSVLLTMAATLRSRQYDRGDTWEKVALPFPSQSDDEKQVKPYYQRNVQAYLRKAKTRSKTLFVLLPGTYATFQKGSMINQMVATLDEIRPRSHYLTFSGFLTDEFLGFEPRIPDLGMHLMGADLYHRIEGFLTNFQNQEDWRADLQEIYLISFSGSGTLAFKLLAVDSGTLFDGAIAFSPILHFRTACDNLDAAIDAMLFDKELPIITESESFESLSNLLPITIHIVKPNGVEYLLDSTRTRLSWRRRAITKLFFNEFFYVDLKRVIEADPDNQFKWMFGAHLNERNLPLTQGNRHRHYYQRYSYWTHQLDTLGEAFTVDQFLEQSRTCNFDASYDQYVDIVPLLEKLQVPLFIVFALDDPVLSAFDFDQHMVIRPELRKTIENIGKLPNIRIFTPNFGAHMGYFLDENWIHQVAQGFFQRNR